MTKVVVNIVFGIYIIMEITTKKQFYYRVENKQKLNDICVIFNTSKENIYRNNSDIELYAGEWIRIEKNDYKIHFVKPTETLQEIAELYNVNIDKLKQYNNLTIDKLYIGQMLKIK